MKRTILLLCTIFAITAAAYAEYPEYAVGLRGGLNWSFVSFEPRLSQPVMPLTFHAGAQFRMVSERYFGIKIELNYSQRGFKTRDDAGSFHRRLDYIELPFMSHITFGEKLFRYFIDLGPSISYLLNDTKSSSAAAIQHTMPIANKFDYGIVGGMGFEFNTKYGIYTIDARYRFGLGNIFKSSAADEFKTSSNQNITISLAYLFPFRSGRKNMY